MQGLDSIEQALNTFARGITSGSRATEQHQVQAIGQSQGGLAQAFYFLAAPHMQGAGNSFVQDRIMSEARAVLQSRDSWSRHFDYDGMGPFFKTSVEIEVLDRNADLYALGIHAAYVGDKPEEGLAEHLGIARTLVWASVEVETAPINGNGFEFDFETILRKLDEVLGTDWASGEQVAESMMTTDKYRESKASFVLHEDVDLRVTLTPGRVERRFDYSNRDAAGNPADTWSVEGAVLRGKLDESYDRDGTFAPPTFVVSLRSAHGDPDSYRTTTIYEPEKKAQALELRYRIAAALQP